MIAAELRGGSKPSLNEALGWIGSRVDDINGVAIGRLEDVWIDPATGEPRWLLVKEGRFGGRSTRQPTVVVRAVASPQRRHEEYVPGYDAATARKTWPVYIKSQGGRR